MLSGVLSAVLGWVSTVWDGRECLDSFWIKVLEKKRQGFWTKALDRAVLAQKVPCYLLPKTNFLRFKKGLCAN